MSLELYAFLNFYAVILKVDFICLTHLNVDE